MNAHFKKDCPFCVKKGRMNDDEQDGITGFERAINYIMEKLFPAFTKKVMERARARERDWSLVGREERHSFVKKMKDASFEHEKGTILERMERIRRDRIKEFKEKRERQEFLRERCEAR